MPEALKKRYALVMPIPNALRDALPVPFTADEVTRALSEVWQASHQPVNRACASVAPAAVQIALQVLPVLQGRNGGWIDFSSSHYDPIVNTPGSNIGRGVNLQCVLYRLVGKKLRISSSWTRELHERALDRLRCALAE